MGITFWTNAGPEVSDRKNEIGGVPRFMAKNVATGFVMTMHGSRFERGPQLTIGFVLSSISRKGGGVFEAARALACTLATQNYARVEVFGLKDEFTEQDLWKWKPLRPRVFPIVGPRAYGYSPKLSRALHESNLDLIHAHGIWMYPSMASLACVTRRGKPLVVSPHGMLNEPHLRHSWWKKKLAGLLYENEHLKRARCMHAFTASEVEYVRHYGLRNPVCIIPNGIDVSADAFETSHTYKPKGKVRKTLLYLGRLHPLKGLVNLLRAWKALQERGNPSIKEWQLAIAGWDQIGHQQELERLCRALSLEPNVSFLGPKFDNEKDVLLKEVNAFILPSMAEGLPMSILEAWAYSLPVLMTPSCNLPEGFDANAAIKISSDNESLTIGLGTLFAMSEEERLEMGKRGLSLVHARFSWLKIAAQWKEVYRWIGGQASMPESVWTFSHASERPQFH